MLTEICELLRNWFDRGQPKYFGDFTVSEGTLVYENGTMEIQTGQYYRIIGSVFNDGIHKYGDENDTLTDENTFDGAVWLLAIPAELVTISGEIDAWMATYMSADSKALSPFQSESFAGYSYSKASGSSGGDNMGSAMPPWFSAFGGRLKRWKKL